MNTYSDIPPIRLRLINIRHRLRRLARHPTAKEPSPLFILTILGDIRLGVEIGRELGAGLLVVVYFCSVILNHGGLALALVLDVAVGADLGGFVEFIFCHRVVISVVLRRVDVSVHRERQTYLDP